MAMRDCIMIVCFPVVYHETVSRHRASIHDVNVIDHNVPLNLDKSQNSIMVLLLAGMCSPFWD